jgi:hypothetical protein
MRLDWRHSLNLAAAQQVALGDPHGVARAPWLDGRDKALTHPAVDSDGVDAELLGSLTDAEQSVAFWRVCGHLSMLAPGAAAPTPIRMGKPWEKRFPIPAVQSGLQRTF